MPGPRLLTLMINTKKISYHLSEFFPSERVSTDSNRWGLKHGLACQIPGSELQDAEDWRYGARRIMKSAHLSCRYIQGLEAIAREPCFLTWILHHTSGKGARYLLYEQEALILCPHFDWKFWPNGATWSSLLSVQCSLRGNRSEWTMPRERNLQRKYPSLHLCAWRRRSPQTYTVGGGTSGLVSLIACDVHSQGDKGVRSRSSLCMMQSLLIWW